MTGEQTADSRDFLKERIISSWYVLKDIHGEKRGRNIPSIIAKYTVVH